MISLFTGYKVFSGLFLSLLLLGSEWYYCSHFITSFRDDFRSWRGHNPWGEAAVWHPMWSEGDRLHGRLVANAGQIWHGIHCIFQPQWHEKVKWKLLLFLQIRRESSTYPNTAVVQQRSWQRRLQLCVSCQRQWTEIRQNNPTGRKWVLFQKFDLMMIWWMLFSHIFPLS